jgi:SRP-independent targeting protein 2/TMEM208
MWDVVHWSWINVVLVVLLGDRAWWLYLLVPAYSVYAVATTVGSLKGMLGGLGGAGSEGNGSMSQSNRQKKMEKKGAQRVAYR